MDLELTADGTSPYQGNTLHLNISGKCLHCHHLAAGNWPAVILEGCGARLVVGAYAFDPGVQYTFSVVVTLQASQLTVNATPVVAFNITIPLVHGALVGVYKPSTLNATAFDPMSLLQGAASTLSGTSGGAPAVTGSTTASSTVAPAADTVVVVAEPAMPPTPSAPPPTQPAPAWMPY